MTSVTRPLGDNQRSAMDAMKRYGGWEPGRGWCIDNGSTTRRILDSLVRRGLVAKEVRTSDRMPNTTYDVYTLTEAGKAHKGH